MSKLWAVARNSYLQAVRNRITGMFLVVMLALVLMLTFISESASRLDTMKTFLAYSVGFGSLLLSVVNILLSCKLMCDDIETHQIYTPITKPIDRRAYVVGRWLGMVLHQLTLIAIMGAVIFATTQYMRNKLGSSGNDTLGQQLFTARVKYEPADFESRLATLINEQTQLRRANGAFGDDMSPEEIAILNESIRREAIIKLTSCPPGKGLHWRFENLPKPAANTENLQLYLKINSSNAFKFDFINRIVALYNPQTGDKQFQVLPLTNQAGRLFSLPSDIITDKGALIVELANIPPEGDTGPANVSLTVGPEDMHILYKVGEFAGNFVRAMLLVLALQAFLSAVSMLAGAALSLPVAILWSTTIYCIGMMASFLLESTSTPNLGQLWAIISSNLAKGLVTLLPNFAMASPVNRLLEGLVISWSDTLITLGIFAVFYSGIALLFGGLILHNRELARATGR